MHKFEQYIFCKYIESLTSKRWNTDQRFYMDKNNGIAESGITFSKSQTQTIVTMDCEDSRQPSITLFKSFFGFINIFFFFLHFRSKLPLPLWKKKCAGRKIKSGKICQSPGPDHLSRPSSRWCEPVLNENKDEKEQTKTVCGRRYMKPGHTILAVLITNAVG